MALDHPIRAAIVGAGLMGAWHARYASKAGACVAAVVDPDRRRAEELAATIGSAQVFGSIEACSGDTDLDVAHICAPTAVHGPLCEAALASGLNVLVEKPLAVDEAQTRRLLDHASTSRRRLEVCLQLPFQRGFRELLDRREELGEPVRIDFRAATAGAEGKSPAERREVLLEILPHPLSVFSTAFGPAAREADWAIDRFDDDELGLSTNIGSARWSISLSLRARPRALELEWSGTSGRAEVDFYHGFAAFHRGQTTRADKLKRPFAEATTRLGRAGANLARRALSGEAAYPGLPELIAAFYDSVPAGPSLYSDDDVLFMAQLGDRIRASV